MIYIIVICLIIIGFLAFKLFQKQKIDKTNLELYRKDLSAAQDEFKQVLKDTSAAEAELQIAKDATVHEQQKLAECKRDIQNALDTYQNILDIRMKEIDNVIEEESKRRTEALEETFHEKRANQQLMYQEAQAECEKQIQKIKDEANQEYIETTNAIASFRAAKAELKQKFDGIINGLMQYEKEKQEKLFYTIQLPEEYQEDIEFLLTTVAAKVQHPDIISKLVWQEYVKPNLEDTFKRIEIKAEPGIYKLTSLINGKCYVGKSVDVKKRIADHFKSVVGIKSIADQAVHHAILKEGFWNWQIEILTYGEKEQLNDLEKYYIEFFKAQEFGYNKTGGG